MSDLLTKLKADRSYHRTFQNAEWAVCCTCGARNFASHKDGNPPCRLARALDCAIAAAEIHVVGFYERENDAHCLPCGEPWPCPTYSAMLAAWDHKA